MAKTPQSLRVVMDAIYGKKTTARATSGGTPQPKGEKSLATVMDGIRGKAR